MGKFWKGKSGGGAQLQGEIQPGTQGIMITCFRDQEARCTSEISQILDSILEIDGVDEDEKDSNQKDSFAESIAAEVAELKSVNSKPYKSLKIGDLGCVVFIKTTMEPTNLVKKLFTLQDGQAQYASRYCQRLIPLSKISKASLEDLRREAHPLIQEAFHSPNTPAKRYAVIFESRFSHSLTRKISTDLLADLVGPKHKVDLENPELVIMVQVFKNLCGVSILPNYYQLKKYNIQEFYKAHNKLLQQS